MRITHCVSISSTYPCPSIRQSNFQISNDVSVSLNRYRVFIDQGMSVFSESYDQQFSENSEHESTNLVRGGARYDVLIRKMSPLLGDRCNCNVIMLMIRMTMVVVLIMTMQVVLMRMVTMIPQPLLVTQCVHTIQSLCKISPSMLTSQIPNWQAGVGEKPFKGVKPPNTRPTFFCSFVILTRVVKIYIFIRNT